MYNRLNSIFEKDKRKLRRFKQLSEKLSHTIKRLDFYIDNQNSVIYKKVSGYSLKKKEKQQSIDESAQRLIKQVDQIEKVISKSNPEIGLDPQMEPFINNFHDAIDRTYNNYLQQISEVKEFELTILEKANVNSLMLQTDSIIIEISNIDNNKRLANIKDIQSQAKAALKKGDKIVAAKLTTEAYYKATQELFTKEFAIEDPEESYEKLTNALLDIDSLRKGAKDKKVESLINLCKNHIKNVRTHIDNGDNDLSIREINISNILIIQVAKALAEEEKVKITNE